MNHDFFMQEALREAEKGLFSTAPNPRVGCVIVKNDKIIARGFHEFAGGNHAEVNALQIAGEEALASTVYVTLEPCSHHGKTPPCADALIKAKVARVVVATLDSNPLVAGSGIKRLNEAGIETIVGICEQEALHLNRGFFKRMQKNLPFVTLKMASSLDGRSALANGNSKWISDEKSRQDVHFLRLQSDAIIAGTGSVINDNALLTARYKTDLPHKNPLRVLIDSELKIPATANVFSVDSPILWAHSKNNIADETVKINASEVEYKFFPRKNNKLDLSALLHDLAKRGCNNVLIEAGADLAGAFLEQKLVDEIILYLAPCFLGQDARASVHLPLLDDLSAKMRMEISQVEKLESDLKITLALL